MKSHAELPDLHAAPLWARYPRQRSPWTNLRRGERLACATAAVAVAALAQKRPRWRPCADLFAGLLAFNAVSGHSFARQITGQTRFEQTTARRAGWDDALLVHESITVCRSREDVFNALKDPAWLSRHLSVLRALRPAPDGAWFWALHTLPGRSHGGTARVTVAVEGERVAWRSEGRTPLRHVGSLVLADAAHDRGTELRVGMAVRVPGGRGGRVLAWLPALSPRHRLRRALREFKQALETGGAATPALRRRA
jgi:uncharacterized membrane protein